MSISFIANIIRLHFTDSQGLKDIIILSYTHPYNVGTRVIGEK